MLKILGSRWFISLIGALLLSLLIWFLGPLLGGGSFWPLESVAASGRWKAWRRASSPSWSCW